MGTAWAVVQAIEEMPSDTGSKFHPQDSAFGRLPDEFVFLNISRFSNQSRYCRGRSSVEKMRSFEKPY